VICSKEANLSPTQMVGSMHVSFASPRAVSQRHSPILDWAFSVVAHLMVLAALFWPHAGHPPPPAEPSPVLVTLVELPKPEPPAPPGPSAPPGSPNTPQSKVSGTQNAVRPSLPHPAAPLPVLAAATTPKPDNSDLLNESQLAGVITADDEGVGDGAGGGGGGGGGGGCNTARVVQQALQRDPLVRSAVEDAHRLGKSVMLWNGDWVRSGEQDGKGLSAVREAIIWELAFAPEACRNKRVHGLVLLSLADGSTRFAIGSGDWSWADLLEVRGVPSDR
jgi:hypothetical protein